MYVALGSPPIKTYVANDRIDVVHYAFNHDRCVSALRFLKELCRRSLSAVFLYGQEQGCSMKGLKSGGSSLSALPPSEYIRWAHRFGIDDAAGLVDRDG